MAAFESPKITTADAGGAALTYFLIWGIVLTMLSIIGNDSEEPVIVRVPPKPVLKPTPIEPVLVVPKTD
jgi:hypothetical protein